MSGSPTLVRPETMIRVSPHVDVIPDQSRRGVPNVGIVVGERRTLVIDTGMGPRNGSLVAQTAASLAPGMPLTLMTTHVHPEHDLGAQSFPSDTLLIRARAQVDEIARTGMTVADDFRRGSDDFRALLEGARFRDADVVFDDHLDLDLGGVRVTLTAMGTNHTEGDTVAFVHGDAVLFSGDVAMRNAPAFASPHSRIRPWLRSLERLRSFEAAIIVPSHGPIGEADMIDRYTTHLGRIGERVDSLRAAGRDHDEVTATVLAEHLDDFGDADRLRGAVRAAILENDEKKAGHDG